VSSRESRVTGRAGHGSKSVTHCHLCSDLDLAGATHNGMTHAVLSALG